MSKIDSSACTHGGKIFFTTEDTEITEYAWDHRNRLTKVTFKDAGGTPLKIVEYAYEHGINYFDTAYRYHNGASETFVGQVLGQYPRESWHLASKMPGHQMRYSDGRLEMAGYLTGLPIGSPADIFEEQLEKCGVDYFDFYLLHNMCETAYDFYTDEDLGLVEYLLAQGRAVRATARFGS